MILEEALRGGSRRSLLNRGSVVIGQQQNLLGSLRTIRDDLAFL